MADHHFVPQFYLRGFHDPAVPDDQKPWIWIADFEEGSVGRRAPKNVGKKANYYALPGLDGALDDTAERLLSQVESAAAPIVRKVVEGCDNLSGQEWADLLFFTAFLAVRTPFLRDMLERFAVDTAEMVMRVAASQPSYFERTFREANKGKELTPEEVEETRRMFLEEGAIKLKANPALSLAGGFDAANKVIYPVFNRMSWAILRPDSGFRFVTSDNPVGWIDPTPRPPFWRGHGLGMANVEVTFPVGPAVCLLGTWKDLTGAIRVNDGVVEEFNRRRVAFAVRQVFAHHEPLARWAQEFRASLQKPQDEVGTT